MKKSHKIVLIVVLAILLGIAIGVYFSEESLGAEESDVPGTTKLSEINRKIKELEEKIQKEVAELKLTSEMETGLNKMVERTCFGVGVTAITFLICFVWFLNYLGLDLINAILSTAGLASILFPIASILLWRNIELNSIISTSCRWTKSWLDKKYGHNPDNIAILSVAVKNKEEQLKELGSIGSMKI